MFLGVSSPDALLARGKLTLTRGLYAMTSGFPVFSATAPFRLLPGDLRGLWGKLFVNNSYIIAHPRQLSRVNGKLVCDVFHKRERGALVKFFTSAKAKF
jgi:hypothetical protein